MASLRNDLLWKVCYHSVVFNMHRMFARRMQGACNIARLGKPLHAEQTSQTAIVYSRQELLDLAPSAKTAGTRHNIPAELLITAGYEGWN